MKRRRSALPSSAAADAVLAATAGEDSWKTWAGRSHGSSHFEWLDLWRGSKRTVEKAIGSITSSTVPPAGTLCPVCYCDPSDTTSDNESNSNPWYITSSCSHAVCLECLQHYAAIQVQDPSHTGPLKCPVCPQVLRRKDAMVALLQSNTGDGDDNGNDSSNLLLRQWDEKIRNQLLRALPSYRACPHCSNITTESTSNSTTTSSTTKKEKNAGGGFVTPTCLAPQYEERHDEASKVLRQGSALALGGLTLAYVCMALYISKLAPSSSPLVDLFFLLVPLAVAVRPNFLLLRRHVAHEARHALFRPIQVECPCCLGSFALPNNDSSMILEDAASQQWMDRHARPCPSCSAPISKQGGCNHMACPNCQANFCWACMQLRSTCRAYQCTNGSPFGNAIPSNSSPATATATATATVANAQVEDSLLHRIDSILNNNNNNNTSTATSSTDNFPYWQNALVVLGLVGRSSVWVQGVVEPVMAIVAAIFASGILSSWSMLLAITSWNAYYQWRQQYEQNNGAPPIINYNILGRWFLGGLRVRQEPPQRAAARHDPPQQQWWEQDLQQQQQQHQGIATMMPRRISAQHQQERRRSSLTASEFLLGADERNQRDRERNNRMTGIASGRRHPPTNVFRTEDEMIREVMRRSLQEQ
jgi:hypothetical protein